MIRYTVSIADAGAHDFRVRCEVASPDPAGQTFRLPAWIRGSYLIRDFARHIVDLRATHAGAPVAFERLEKSSFRCAPCAGTLTLDYRVYAFDESVRKAFLDQRRGFFNGSSLFYCPAGAEKRRLELTIERPEDPALRHWKVATTLAAIECDAHGFGRYFARDYEELIDHPVELGAFTKLEFDVDGVAHALVLSGKFEIDGARATRDLQRICHQQRELFGQQPKLDRYLFLTRVVGVGYGGLEHRASTALICSRNDLPLPGQAEMTKDYRGFLGLCSHEYFHLWNVKRITALAFLDADLSREAYTRDLWHYEGITSYYDDFMLLRAGVLDPAAYLDVVAETMTRLVRAPGHQLHTLADASFEAWIKYYQPDENSPNATVSYYIKGSLAALCLDLHLRLHSKVTLDDVMRTLWQRFGREQVGVPEGGLEAVAMEISGLDLKQEFDAWLRSTAPLPIEALLGEFGVKSERRAAISDADTGGRVVGKAPALSLGMKLKPGETTVAFVTAGGAAQRAGLSAGDQLLALNGLRVTPTNLLRLLMALRPAQDYLLYFFRGDELMRVTVRPEPAALDTWTVTLTAAEGDKLARRKAWLGA
jgi:predicted metalloprotease with PDZ domain